MDSSGAGRQQGSDRPVRSWQQCVLLEDAVWGEVDSATAIDLRRVIDAAVDERPVQRFLSEHPEVFAAAVLRGHTRCVRSQLWLGAEFVPDFVIADVSSIAVQWTLVELESPKAPMFIANGDFAVKTREALHQIGDWRSWLTQNLSYARRPKPNGLGLIGIDPGAPGLVLVGRRPSDRGPEPDEGWIRRSTRDGLRISVHTYDWLLELVDDCAVGGGGVHRNPPFHR